MMRIFILEDDGTRMGLFRETLMGKAVTHWGSVDNGIKAVTAAYAPFDLFLLDHDLGDPKDYGDGTQFAELLVKHKITPRDTIIHSHNPDGAARMQRILEDGGWAGVRRIPFGVKLLDVLRVL